MYISKYIYNTDNLMKNSNIIQISHEIFMLYNSISLRSLNEVIIQISHEIFMLLYINE